MGKKDIIFCAWDISICWLGQDIILNLPNWGQLPPPWDPPQKLQWDLSCFPMATLFSPLRLYFYLMRHSSDYSHDPGSYMDSLALGCCRDGWSPPHHKARFTDLVKDPWGDVGFPARHSHILLPNKKLHFQRLFDLALSWPYPQNLSYLKWKYCR